MESPEYIEKIANLLGRILLVSLRLRLPEEVRRVGITFPQLQCLIFLTHHGACSIGEIAGGLCTSHPAAVQMSARLANKGLARKTPSDADRRISRVELTDLGLSMANIVARERLQPIEDGLRELSIPERQGLVQGLEKLVANILKDERVVEFACLRCGEQHDGECVINRAHVALTGAGIERP
jgi:DNA-binding MarR family transcriptional regulator